MFAVTERLLLRPGWPDDAARLTRAIANEKIARNLAQLPWPYDERDADWFLANCFSPTTPEHLITLRQTGEIIGGIGIHPDPEDARAKELGYWIAEGHWGLGYATEAGRAVIANARLSLRYTSLRSAYFEDNPASGRVLEKLGFRRTGAIVKRRSAGRNADVSCVLMAQAFVATGGADPMPQMRMAA